MTTNHNIIAVTGANGHLGNNIVRFLEQQSFKTVSIVRQASNTNILDDTKTEIRRADYKDTNSLMKSLQGVDTVVHTAAVFKRWSPNLQKDIIEENILLSKNIVEAAGKAGIKKMIYISSIAALEGRDELDSTTWNSDAKKAYPYSKALSEKAARDMANKYNIQFIALLPSAIIGPNFSYETPTLKLLSDIYYNKLPFTPAFRFFFVDARDVAKAAHLALLKGKHQARYIISHPNSLAVAELIDIGIKNITHKKIKRPGPVAKPVLFFIAKVSELMAKLTRKEPLLSVEDAKEYWGANPSFDEQIAYDEIGFEAMPLEQSVIDTFNYFEVVSSAKK
jgi:dihydroflavonol-4-reductase